MIQHTVVFSLKHKKDSRDERDFLEAALGLEKIPGVQSFRRFRQVSSKNSYSLGLSMQFVSEEAYKAYNEHPLHKEFVSSRWIPEVTDFMEIDYIPYKNPEQGSIDG